MWVKYLVRQMSSLIGHGVEGHINVKSVRDAMVLLA
jgi:hypothetical protein